MRTFWSPVLQKGQALLIWLFLITVRLFGGKNFLFTWIGQDHLFQRVIALNVFIHHIIVSLEFKVAVVGLIDIFIFKRYIIIM